MIYKNALVVEKDKIHNTVICESCRKCGLRPVAVANEYRCMDYLSYCADKFAIIILSLDIKAESCVPLLSQIRKITDVPVLCVTTDCTFSAITEALRNGADDCVVIPFDVYEFIERINCVLKRYQKCSVAEILTFKDIFLDVKRHFVLVNDKYVDLTHKEFQILKLLMSHPKETISKEQIFSEVWRCEMYMCETLINTHVCNLRRKINMNCEKDKYIYTVRGQGYRLSL